MYILKDFLKMLKLTKEAYDVILYDSGYTNFK